MRWNKNKNLTCSGCCASLLQSSPTFCSISWNKFTPRPISWVEPWQVLFAAPPPRRWLCQPQELAPLWPSTHSFLSTSCFRGTGLGVPRLQDHPLRLSGGWLSSSCSNPARTWSPRETGKACPRILFSCGWLSLGEVPVLSQLRLVFISFHHSSFALSWGPKESHSSPASQPLEICLFSLSLEHPAASLAASLTRLLRSSEMLWADLHFLVLGATFPTAQPI